MTRYLPEASTELDEATAYYEDRRVGLGRDFLDQIAVAVRRMETAPHAPREIQPGVRQVLTKRFPYAVVYIADGDDLVVVAFAHLHRDRTIGPTAFDVAQSLEQTGRMRNAIPSVALVLLATTIASAADKAVPLPGGATAHLAVPDGWTADVVGRRVPTVTITGPADRHATVKVTFVPG